jgi:hypothetical protein
MGGCVPSRPKIWVFGDFAYRRLPKRDQVERGCS